MTDPSFLVRQAQHGVHIAVGDEVEFIMGVNPKSGDRLARKLKRTKEAPAAPPPEVVPERNPNAMKFTGNLKVTLLRKSSPHCTAPSAGRLVCLSFVKAVQRCAALAFRDWCLANSLFWCFRCIWRRLLLLLVLSVQMASGYEVR